MAEVLRNLRIRLGWSQYRMADELGVSQPTVWRIEHDQQQPSKSVEKLIGILRERVEAADALIAKGPASRSSTKAAAEASA